MGIPREELVAVMLRQLEQSKLSTSNIGPLQILEQKMFSQFLPGQIEGLEEIADLTRIRGKNHLPTFTTVITKTKPPKEEFSIGPIQILAEGFLECLPEKMEALKEAPAAPTQIRGGNALPTFTTVQTSKEENVEEISNGPIQFLRKDDTLELVPAEMKSPKNKNVVEINIADILNSSSEDENENPNPNQPNPVKNVQMEKRLIPTLSGGINKGCQKPKVARGTIWLDIFKTVPTADDQDKLKKIAVTEPPSTASMCDSRDKKFKKKSMLEAHSVTHFSSEQQAGRMKPCSMFEKTFTTAHTLRRQVKCIHSNKEPFQCKECPFSPRIMRKHVEGEDNVFNSAENLEAGEQLVLNFNKNVDKTTTLGISDSDKTYKREKDSEEINWADAYRTIESPYPPVRKKLEKIIIIKAPATAAVVEPHEFTCLDPNEIICNHCQQIFGDLYCLKVHIRRMHRNVSNMYQCPYCPYKKKRKESVRDHIISRHTDENDIKWFECHTCGKKFTMKWILTNHIYTHLNPAQLRDYIIMKQCTMCSKSFKTASQLKGHIRFVHEKIRRRHQCQHCEYSDRHISALRKHIEVYHTTPDQRLTYECEKCDYKTTFEYKLKQHMKTHKDQLYCCEKCAYVTHDGPRFKLHQVTHQTTVDEKTLRFRCDKCDYKTYRGYSLNVHKLNHLKPDEIKYFCCYHCDFKAKRKDNLKTHVLKHFKNEEVVFQCFKCDFSTKKRPLLSDHLRQKHSKVQIQSKDS